MLISVDICVDIFILVLFLNMIVLVDISIYFEKSVGMWLVSSGGLVKDGKWQWSMIDIVASKTHTPSGDRDRW